MNEFTSRSLIIKYVVDLLKIKTDTDIPVEVENNLLGCVRMLLHSSYIIFILVSSNSVWSSQMCPPENVVLQTRSDAS